MTSFCYVHRKIRNKDTEQFNDNNESEYSYTIVRSNRKNLPADARILKFNMSLSRIYRKNPRTPY